MTLIVDASVAVKWILEEVGTATARALLGSEPLFAPDFLLLEAHHVVWKSVRRGDTAGEVLGSLMDVLPVAFDRVFASGNLMVEAAKKSQSLAHPIYDCLYIVLAEREDATLITVDERQFMAARKARVKARLL